LIDSSGSFILFLKPRCLARHWALASLQRSLDLMQELIARQPADANGQMTLAGTHCNLGNALRREGELNAAMEHYALAATALEGILEKEPRQATARFFLRNTCWGRAQTLMRLGNFSEAAEVWRRAIELNTVPETAITFRIELAESLAHAGDHADAASEASGLVASESASGETLYNLASAFSLCAVAAKDDTAIAHSYAERAIGLLKRSQSAGYFGQADNIAHFRQDQDFDALRDREDFRQFASQLSITDADQAPTNP
jgi:tetratricopeptide (TPR) repeat protein